MKKMMLLLIFLFGYANMEAAADNRSSITQSSYEIAPYLAAATYVMQSRGLYTRGTPSFFNPDQCTFILADDTIGDGQQRLHDQCKVLPKGNTDADIFAILQSVSSPATNALMFIAHREHLFLGVKGSHSRILVTKVEGTNVTYRQENDGMTTKKMIRTSAIQSIAFLRGITLPDGDVAEIIQSFLKREDKTAQDVAFAIAQTDGGENAAVGFFYGYLWGQAYQKIRYNVEDVSALKTKVFQQESPDQIQLMHGAGKQGCCQLI